MTQVISGEKVSDPLPIEKTRSLLIYWIKERYDIFSRRKIGVEKPWSSDLIFQRTYFCNVHRENDRVTQFIRKMYSHHVDDVLFEYNMILARFLNWPPTLEHLGYVEVNNPDALYDSLKEREKAGHQIWNGAYLITTCGVKMEKLHYLTHVVLDSAFKRLDTLKYQYMCAGMAIALRGIDGVGSFLAGQVVADLKNTPGHNLYEANDRRSFVTPGPGSLRGASWFAYGVPVGVTPASFMEVFMNIREYVDQNWPKEVPPVDNQDLQNCLCEYDKYMRVLTGTGRSKRGYKGV